jgi:hypothetical protein
MLHATTAFKFGSYTHNPGNHLHLACRSISQSWFPCVFDVESYLGPTADVSSLPVRARDAAKIPSPWFNSLDSRWKTHSQALVANHGVSIIASFTFLEQGDKSKTWTVAELRLLAHLAL